MRTILGLLAIAAIVAAIIIGYNWMAGNNNIKIESPSRGETLYTNSAVVRLNASENTKATLATTGSDYEIVTYVDGTEVHRGKELTYQINGLTAGNHQLKVAIADNRSEGVNLNGIALQPGAVDFSVAARVANSNNIGTLNSAAIPEPTPIVVEAPPAAPAAPQPTVAPVPALPASGGGGGQLADLANSSAVNNSAANNSVVYSNPVLFSTINDAPPPAPETPMQSVFRSLMAFYVAGFVVAFGFVFLTIRRRARRRNQFMSRSR